MVQGILLAILQREKTGRGQRIAVSLLDSMLAAQTQEAAAHLMRGREVNWGAMPLSGVFPTSDSALVMVGAFKADPLGDISKALGIDHLGKDPRFATFNDQVANKPALQAIFKKRFKSGTTAHWLARLEEQDLLCAPVRSLAEALADEQTAINEMIIEADGDIERIKVIGSPIHMTDAPVAIRTPPPSLGRDTDAVRAELGRAANQAAE
jgi:formyl-CoA transferase